MASGTVNRPGPVQAIYKKETGLGDEREKEGDLEASQGKVAK